MMAPTLIDSVAKMLTQVGYRPLPLPLKIAGLRFELEAAFVGRDRVPDLIIVEYMNPQKEKRLLRKIEGIARAMDVVRSKRPLTAVLAGPRPQLKTLYAMSCVCRVLPIVPDTEIELDEVLKNWLAVLMPLNLPSRTANEVESISSEDLSVALKNLVDMAQFGPDAVRTRFHEIISKPLANADKP